MISRCPGFGQDRINFHQNPGRDTAGRADPTWPNRAGYSIPCAIMLGSGGGERGGGNSLSRLGSTGGGGGGRLSGLCSLCCVFSLSVSLLFLFPLFAVLLTALIPTHQFLPVSFHFPPHPGGGRGGHVALLLPAAAKPGHKVTV